MSTSRSIYFLAEDKTPMVDYIFNVIRKIHNQRYPKYPPHIIKSGQYECQGAMEAYSSMWILPDGEDLTYFGGEEVFGNKFETYNKKYKLWAYMGGSNTTYLDKDTGTESFYPVPHFKALMEEIKKTKIKNDVLLLCTTSSGGYNHRTYPACRKLWTGKFI